MKINQKKQKVIQKKEGRKHSLPQNTTKKRKRKAKQNNNEKRETCKPKRKKN